MRNAIFATIASLAITLGIIVLKGRLGHSVDSASGAAQQQPTNKVVNVMEFGALGDGKTNDTAAFDAAVAALPTNGGTILIPPGVFLLKNWTISKDGVHVIGAGSGYLNGTVTGATSLRAANGISATDDVIRVSGVTTLGVTIEHVHVNASPPDGRSLAKTTIASNATRLVLNHVNLSPATNWSFNNSVGKAAADSADSGGIYNSSIGPGGNGIRVTAASFRIERNYFNGNGLATAIKIEGPRPGIALTSITISNNTFDSYSTPIIDATTRMSSGVRSLTISNNRIDSNAGVGNQLDIGDGRNGIEGVRITGNYIAVSSGKPARAIKVTKGVGVVIEGNDIVSSTYAGGTNAPILVSIPLGGHIIQGNKNGFVEYNGFKSQSFVSSNISNANSTINGTVIVKRIVVQTTNAKPVTAYAVKIANSNESVQVFAKVIGFEAKGGSQITFFGVGAARNTGAGAAGLSTTDIHKNVAGTTADVAFDVDGNDLRLRLTGISAKKINWLIDIEFIRQ